MRSRVDLVHLSPCRDSLIPHIQRANHRRAHLKLAAYPIVETPQPHEEGQGWVKSNESIEPLWS